MNIIDELNAKVERDRASIRALARACGVTVAEMDEDMRQPDPVVSRVEMHIPGHGRYLDAHWVHPGDQEEAR